MKELTKQQEDFLLLIARNETKSISELGRKVYATYKSCYDVCYLLQTNGYIDVMDWKNKMIPIITEKGIKKVQEIFKSREI